MISSSALTTNDLLNLRYFAWWAAIMVLKILSMAPLTAQWRFSKKIFISPEDRFFIKESKTVRDDEDIGRVRRAHLNDLENILPWAVSTAFWLTISPDPTAAALLIKCFCISRVFRTVVYAVIVIPQPARVLAFSIGFLIPLYQSLMTVYHYR